MRRNSIAKWALVAILAVAVSGLVHALVLQLWLDDGLALRGIWTWNYGSSAMVKVRIQSVGYHNGYPGDGKFPPYLGAANVRILVKARAEDGSAVQGYALGQIAPGAIREFTISLPKRITQLQFLQVVRFSAMTTPPE